MQNSAVEAAHNPEVRGSKPRSATFVFSIVSIVQNIFCLGQNYRFVISYANILLRSKAFLRFVGS